MTRTEIERLIHFLEPPSDNPNQWGRAIFDALEFGTVTGDGPEFAIDYEGRKEDPEDDRDEFKILFPKAIAFLKSLITNADINASPTPPVYHKPSCLFVTEKTGQCSCGAFEAFHTYLVSDPPKESIARYHAKDCLFISCGDCSCGVLDRMVEAIKTKLGER